MRKVFLFAFTLLSVNSVFAMSDSVQCINGKTVVNTAYFAYDKGLFLTIHYLVPDAQPLQATVTTKSKIKSKRFTGQTSNGTQISLKIERFNDMKGTLFVEGREPETLVCKEQVFFPL